METTLAAIARDLARAGAEAPVRAAAAVEASAYAVKTTARANAVISSGTHAKQYPATISYSIDVGGLGAEIGPEKRGQGNLGPILENGSMHNPPHRDLGRALDLEEPLFLDAAAKLALPWL